MNDLVKDLSDGVKLIQLLVSVSLSVYRCDSLSTGPLQEIMSGTPLGRYNPKPKMRVQKAEASGGRPCLAEARSLSFHAECQEGIGLYPKQGCPSDEYWQRR